MIANEETIKKVRWVYRQKDVQVHSNGKTCIYYYWLGYWKENGKSRGVFLGKELPGELQYLIEGRKRSKSGKVYHWPKHPVKMIQKGSYIF